MDTPDPVTRLNAALEGRYRIEREIGEGGMATVLFVSLSVLLVGACGGDKEPAGPTGTTQPVVAMNRTGIIGDCLT